MFVDMHDGRETKKLKFSDALVGHCIKYNGQIWYKTNLNVAQCLNWPPKCSHISKVGEEVEFASSTVIDEIYECTLKLLRIE